MRSERFQPYFVAAFTLWLVGAVEIIQKTGGQRLEPRFWMFIAILITVYSGVRIFRLSPPQPKLRSRKASSAEQGMVNRIRANGLAVYHESTQQKRGGYVVVGAAGVYALEVKEGSVFGSGTVDYRKENELVLGGRISDPRPLKQAQAAAQKMREKLQTVLPKRSTVKPLVVFLNEWRINRSATQSDVAVVSANELEQYLSGQEPTLSQSEVTEISTCLNDLALAAAR